MLEHHGSQGPALLAQLLDLCPTELALHAQLQVVGADLSQLETAALLAVAVVVLGQAAQQPQYIQRYQFDLSRGLLQRVRQQRQVQVLPLATFGIRRLFAEDIEQALLQLQGIFQALTGGPDHPVAQVQREP